MRFEVRKADKRRCTKIPCGVSLSPMRLWVLFLFVLHCLSHFHVLTGSGLRWQRHLDRPWLMNVVGGIDVSRGRWLAVDRRFFHEQRLAAQRGFLLEPFDTSLPRQWLQSVLFLPMTLFWPGWGVFLHQSFFASAVCTSASRFRSSDGRADRYHELKQMEQVCALPFERRPYRDL